MSYSYDKSGDRYGDRNNFKYNNQDSDNQNQDLSSKFDYSSEFQQGNKEKEIVPEKNKNEPLVKPGPLSYSNFLKNKHAAFWFFAQNQKTKQRLNEDDITLYMQTSKSYDNILGGVYFGAIAFSFGVDYYLRYSNMLYGITYKWSLGKFLFKYWVIPYVAVLGIGSVFINPKYKPVLDNIVNKYDFNETLFQQTYEEERDKKPTK